MELTWKQRLAARLYKNALSTLAVVSPALAARKAFNLMCTPLFGPYRKPLSPFFASKARVLNFLLNDHNVRGYEFLPEQEPVATVLIAHGFSSYCYKFESYIQAFHKKGYRVLAFDAPAHGMSEGKYLHSLLYRNMLLKVEELHGPIHHLIGHSIAGLAISLALETGRLTELKSVVLMAPAAEAKTAFDQFYRVIPLPQKVRTGVDEIILKTNGQPIEWYSANRALEQVQIPILWIHDEEDKITPLADGQPTMDRSPENILFYVTKGLGHNRIYREGKVKRLVQIYIQKGPEQARAEVEKLEKAVMG
jgi:pimeloyl-ACP methyl ester carboxylesterase